MAPTPEQLAASDWAVNLELRCANQSDAEAVRDYIDANKGVVKFARTAVSIHPDDMSGDPAARLVLADLKVDTQNRAEQIYTLVQNRWSSGPQRNLILAGSTVAWHRCFDQPEGATPPAYPCGTPEYPTTRTTKTA